MGYEEVLEKFNEIPKAQSIELVRLLLKIADNIIKNPNNAQIRTLHKSNPTISKKILQIHGGIDCLILMGFQEDETSFILPAETNLNSVLHGRDALLMWKESIQLAEKVADSNTSSPSTSNGNLELEKRPSIELSRNQAWNYSNGEIIKPIVLPRFTPLHKCGKCQELTPFARYDDLNVLLQTRRGRCGEWANVFTLFCRALGWDARFVCDENDHVWTEVYSIAQGRWLHCDPCENICDKPLIYESGWKKKMTYVIAYSNDEIQDVTWRYCSNYQEVLERRKLCDEGELIKVLMELNCNRQLFFSRPRILYLYKRTALELAEMLIERQPGEEENKGRQSGEANWRLARGDIEIPLEFVWIVDMAYLVNNTVCLRYSAAKDVYQFVSGGVVRRTLKKWAGGCFNYKNITRKEEKDWKQVYLARNESDSEAHISWKFDFRGDPSQQLDTIIVYFNQMTFENGKVIAKICSGDFCEVIPGDKNMLKTRSFAGKTTVIVDAVLSGGKGDVAWQHTQLFRQPIDDNNFPFVIHFVFTKIYT